MPEESHSLMPDTHLLTKFFGTSPIGIVVEDMEGTPLYVNPAFCSFLGFSEEELRRKHCVDFSPPEDAKKDWALFQQLQAGSIDHYQLEKRYIRSDSSLVWGRLSISSLRDFSVPLILAMVEDITERKRTQEALQQREMELTEAQRLAGLGSWQWEQRTDTVIWSKELYHLMGIDPTLPAPSYKEHAHLFTAESWERLQRAVQEALQTETPYELDLEVVRPESIVKWEIARGEPVRDQSGQIIGLRGTVQNITERKQAEEALRASEERLRLAQQAARIGSFEWNIQDGVNTWNSELEALYGLPEGGFAGTQKAFEELLHLEDRERVKNLVAVSMESGKPTKGEWRAVWPDGSIHWVAGRWQVYKDDTGSPHRMVGVSIDIDERKRAEQVLADAPRKLIEAHEEERAWIARELHDDISQQIALLSVDLDQWTAQGGPREESVIRARRRLEEIAADVQNLSHRLHSSKLDYLGLRVAAKSFCEELSANSGVKVNFQYSDVPATIPREVSLCLFRVLQESLQNAVKHSGVRSFEVKLVGKADAIELTVSDDGSGFNVEEAFLNSGLGLVSMRERIQIVQGEMEIRSSPGAGTTICARVPWHRSQQALAG